MTALPADAAAQSPAQALARAYLAGAQRRERSARHLSERRDWVGALRLYSDATLLLLRAHLASSGDERTLDELAPAALLDAVLELARRERWQAPAELERVRSLLDAREWNALDRLDEPGAERARDDLETAVRFLIGSLAEVRKAERRRERQWFLAGVSLLGLVALGTLLWSVTRPPNLALKRPVEAAPAGFATEASEAVDGIRFGAIGYHSEGNSPWLRVDLEGEHTVRRVALYGRGDCCFGASLPLTVEGSRDGSSYEVLGQITEPFKPFRPSVLQLQPKSVRYLRLRSPRRSPLMIAEVEVY